MLAITSGLATMSCPLPLSLGLQYNWNQWLHQHLLQAPSNSLLRPYWHLLWAVPPAPPWSSLQSLLAVAPLLYLALMGNRFVRWTFSLLVRCMCLTWIPPAQPQSTRPSMRFISHILGRSRLRSTSRTSWAWSAARTHHSINDAHGPGWTRSVHGGSYGEACILLLFQCL